MLTTPHDGQRRQATPRLRKRTGEGAAEGWRRGEKGGVEEGRKERKPQDWTILRPPTRKPRLQDWGTGEGKLGTPSTELGKLGV